MAANHRGAIPWACLMPEDAAVAVYGFTAEQWLRYAEFHAKAAAVMCELARALKDGDQVSYYVAMTQFALLAGRQEGHRLVVNPEALA